MPELSMYEQNYRFVAFRRDAGILEIRIHDNGGPATWSAYPGGLHDELGRAFRDVARDDANRVVIITGTGDRFLTEFDWSVPDPTMGTPPFWNRIIREGLDLLTNYLDIPVPVIGAVNGPCFIHSEIPTMADIVLASDTAAFADKAHSPLGVVPGDGVQIWWQMLLGPNRGRHFLLTGAEISAADAKALGIVAEVVPQAALQDRAWDVARALAAKPISMLRHSRTAFNQHIKRRMLEELGYGLHLEGLAAMSMAHDTGG
jgi:enoyl-CoA hydratase/carnithine racemase